MDMDKKSVSRRECTPSGSTIQTKLPDRRRWQFCHLIRAESSTGDVTKRCYDLFHLYQRYITLGVCCSGLQTSNIIQKSYFAVSFYKKINFHSTFAESFFQGLICVYANVEFGFHSITNNTT